MFFKQLKHYQIINISLNFIKYKHVKIKHSYQKLFLIMIKIDEKTSIYPNYIQYKDGLDVIHRLDKNNIEDLTNLEFKFVMKTKFYNGQSLYSICQTLTSNQKSQSEINVFSDYPNLYSLKSIFHQDDITMDLFSFKNWCIQNNDINKDYVAPFLFLKKEEFNCFKQLDKNIVDIFLLSNKYFKHDNINLMKSNSLISIYAFIFVFLKPIENKANFNNSIGFFYKKFIYETLSELFSTNILNIYQSNEELDNFKYRLKHLFRLFALDFTYLYENNHFCNIEDNKENLINKDLLKSRMELYKKLLSFYLKYKNDYDFFKNIDKQNKFEKLMKIYLDFLKREHEISSYRRKFFLGEDNINESTLYVEINNNPSIVMDNYIFTPVLNEYQFESEGAYMGNCIKGRYDNCKVKSLTTSNTISLVFHIVKMNPLEHNSFKDYEQMDLETVREIKSNKYDKVISLELKVKFETKFDLYNIFYLTYFDFKELNFNIKIKEIQNRFHKTTDKEDVNFVENKFIPFLHDYMKNNPILISNV